jgi:hypothetical protein
MYNHCNMCNIPIYFYSICMQHLQHTSKTFETLEIDACNMRFSPFFRTTQRRRGTAGFGQPTAEDEGTAALTKHAHGAWRRRARRR